MHMEIANRPRPFVGPMDTGYIMSVNQHLLFGLFVT